MLTTNDVTDDVLLEIFRWSIFGRCHLIAGYKQPRIAVSYGHHPSTPVVLSHVCSKWRNLVISTPTLWNRIFPIFPRSAFPNPGDVSMANLWLERSKTAPLTVEYHDKIPGTGQDGLEQTSIEVDLLKTLVAHSDRWVSVTLRVGQHIFADKRWWEELDVSNLEKCLVSSSDFSITPRTLTNEDLLNRLSASPQLRIINFNPRWYTPSWLPSIPWRQLLKVKLQGVLTSEQVIEMFRSCQDSTLEDCTVMELRDSTSDSVANHPASLINVPKLKTLSLDLVHGAPKLLSHLSLPRLNSLSIIIRGDDPDVTNETWNYVSQLGAQSRWRLSRLRIIGYQRHYRQALNEPTQPHKLILHPAFSCLTHLGLRSATNAMLGALTWHIGDGLTPLPHLSVLHLTELRAQGDVLLDMVLSRVRSVEEQVLRRVHLLDIEHEVETIRQVLQSKVPEIIVDCPWEDEWMQEGMRAYEYSVPRI